MKKKRNFKRNKPGCPLHRRQREKQCERQRDNLERQSQRNLLLEDSPSPDAISPWHPQG